MRIANCDFTNEREEKVQMVVFEDRNGITVTYATDTTSYEEYIMTPKEASMLFELLSNIGVKPFKKMRRTKK